MKSVKWNENENRLFYNRILRPLFDTIILNFIYRQKMEYTKNDNHPVKYVTSLVPKIMVGARDGL